MGASLFYGRGSVIGEARPKQSAVHLILKMRGRRFNVRMGRYFAQTDCAGVQGSPFQTLRPTLTSDPSCRLILSSAILPSIPLRPRPSVGSGAAIQTLWFGGSTVDHTDPCLQPLVWTRVFHTL